MSDPVDVLLAWRDRITAAIADRDTDPSLPPELTVDLGDLSELVWAADTLHAMYVGVRSDLAVVRAQGRHP